MVKRIRGLRLSRLSDFQHSLKMPVLDLSIIIVSYNTKDLLRDCLLAVYRTVRGLSFEVVVVDNASADGSVEMVLVEFPNVRIISNDENLGFARANNQAIALVGGEFVLLLNSDAFLREHTIDKLIAYMREHPGVAVSGPKVLKVDGTLQSKGECFPYIVKSVIDLLRMATILGKEKLAELFPNYYWDENVSRPVDWLLGCCLMVRREVFDRVGLLSEAFFFYGEETEWCYRVRRAGYEVIYVADATVVHIGEGSFLDERRQRRVDGMVLYYQKTAQIFRGIAITIITMLFIASRFLFLCVTSRRKVAQQGQRKVLVAYLGFLAAVLKHLTYKALKGVT